MITKDQKGGMDMKIILIELMVSWGIYTYVKIYQIVYLEYAHLLYFKTKIYTFLILPNVFILTSEVLFLGDKH